MPAEPHDEDEMEGKVDRAATVNHAESVTGAVVQAGTIHEVHLHSHYGQAPLPKPAAKPVAEWSATVLGMHASIVVSGDAPTSDLPPYVVRRHDEYVRRLLDSGSAASLMVVLVGGSAVGKTRTAYEALLASERVRSWPVIVPTGPVELRDVLAAGVSGQHVLWLNDLRSRFLDSSHGAELAERLTSVLRGDEPVLVLADLWPSHLDVLADDPVPIGAAAAHVRHLFQSPRVELVTVPDDFTEVERTRLQDSAARDRRLALALESARADLKITQVLAGGPQLLGAYTQHRYTDHAHALITAALDLTRLSAWTPVALDVLRGVTAGYLNPSQRVVKDGWFDAALENASRPWQGVPAVTPFKADLDTGAADHCTVHDYLLHETSKPGRRRPPPAGFWTALAEQPFDAKQRGRLGMAAMDRGLYRLAARFALQAADDGDTDAMLLLAMLCKFRGAEDDARDWRRRAYPTDVKLPLGLLSSLLSRNTTDPPDRTTVSGTVAHPPGHEGRDDDSLARLRELTEAGDPIALLRLTSKLSDNGADDEAGRIMRRHAEGDDGRPGDPSAMWALAEWLVRHDRVPEAVHWFALSAEHSLQGANLLVERLSELGHLEAAERPLRALAGERGGLATRELAKLYGLLGRHDEAVTMLRESVEWGESPSTSEIGIPPLMLSALVEALVRAGRTREAAQLRAYGIEPGGATSEPWGGGEIQPTGGVLTET